VEAEVLQAQAMLGAGAMVTVLAVNASRHIVHVQRAHLLPLGAPSAAHPNRRHKHHVTAARELVLNISGAH